MTRADIIEAAARAWWERGQARRMDAGRLGDDGLPLRWEDVHEDVRHADRLVVAPVVEAVLAAVGWAAS